MKTKIILICLLWVSICFADPAPTGVTGTLSNGESVVISGSSFGTNALNQNWTGANIEAGTTGNNFSLSGWTVYNDSISNAAVKYSETLAHSGSKSLVSVFYDARYDSLFYLDTGASRTEWYFTMWVYIDKNDASTFFQWKHFRLNNNTTVTMESGFASNIWWYAENGGWFDDWSSNDFEIYTTTDGVTTRPGVFYPNPEAYNDMGTWQRIEIYVKKSSSAGTGDGIATWNRVDQPTYAKSNTSLVTHNAQDVDWRYLFPSIFYGSFEGITRDANIYYDDIFVSDTRARVEIGNASTWATCTHREIQVPTAWATGEITVIINQGSFEDGTAYLYVVDATGAVNSDGYLITLGEVVASGQPISGGMISGGSFQ